MHSRPKDTLFESSDTYVSRTKRAFPLIHDEEILDVGHVEKKLVDELGNNVCIYERICAHYADRSFRRRSRKRFLDWDEVFRYDTDVDDVIDLVSFIWRHDKRGNDTE